MSDNGIKRQLKAIFSADVKGYSKLMGDDDETTVKTITIYREIIIALSKVPGLFIIARNSMFTYKGKSTLDIHLMLGQVLAFSDRPQKAIENLEMSIRLDPFARSQFFHMLGMAYREAGRYDEAINACQEAIRRQRNNLKCHFSKNVYHVATNGFLVMIF